MADTVVNDIFEPDRLAIRTQIDIAKKSGETTCIYLSPIPDEVKAEFEAEGITFKNKETAANPALIYILSWGETTDGTVQQNRVDNISATFELPQNIQ